jgi:hypothetical protein
MAELSGSLEDIGLTALVRFLADVNSTGLLTLERERAAGNLTFRDGRIIAASFGSARGLDAVEAMAVALPDGWFVYIDGEVAGDPDPSLLTTNVFARIDELARSRAARADPLSLSAVPRIVDSEPRPDFEASRLSLDRAALRVLLAVDGQRTVSDLLSIGRPVEVIEHLRALADAGVITFDAPGRRRLGTSEAAPAQAPDYAGEPIVNGSSRPSAPAGYGGEPANGTAAPPETPLPAERSAPPRQNGATGEPHTGSPPPAATPPSREEAPRPVAPAANTSQSASASGPAQPAQAQRIGPRPPSACPKLGFGDDPTTAFPRPTRLHRCFAFGRPQILSTEQQELLCLLPDHITCPRLQGHGAPPGRGPKSAKSSGLSAAIAAGAVPSPTFDDALAPGPTDPSPAGPVRPTTTRDRGAAPPDRMQNRRFALAAADLERDWRALWAQYRVTVVLLALVLAVVVVAVVVFVNQIDNGSDLSSLPNAATASALDSATPPASRRATPTLAAPPALATPEPDQDATPPA